MHFILNGSIKFNPELCEISIVNENENCITLSKPATRLLEELIRQSKTVVSRDELIKKVWDDYGFTPSNNNLYMAISELRKSIRILGDRSEMIVTVPRSGIKIQADIESVYNGGGQKLTSVAPKEKKAKASWRVFLFRVAGGGVCFVSIILAAKAIVDNSRVLIRDVSYNETFRYEKCDVSFIGKILPSEIKSLQDEVVVKLRKYNINCQENSQKVYFSPENTRSNMSRELFLGVCKMDGGEGARCLTIKEING
jgi:DNA-binding winged helix-turn-helix (wHTH) protein